MGQADNGSGRVGRVVASVKEQLGEKNSRLTPQREAILRILVGKGNKHLKAEDIYLLSKDQYPDIGLATVYRTLELFERLGIVYRLDYGDGQSRYEFNPQIDEHYHHHLICLGCGKIQEFNDDLLEGLEKTIAARTDFQITDHCLRVFGYCAQCQAKRQLKQQSDPC